MINRLKTLSPLTKLLFVLSLLILLLWVIPTMVSFFKNQKLHAQRVTTLEKLDNRENNNLSTKPFHAEVFKVDAGEYFDKVEVVASSDNRYKITLQFQKENLSKFHTFLKNISLNYRVSLEESITYKEINKSMSVGFTVRPF